MVKQSTNKLWPILAMVITLLFSSLANSAPVPYVDLALGLGVHALDDSDQGAVSNLIKTGLGVQWLPYLSTHVGVWLWSSKEQQNREAQEAQDYRRGYFDGLSTSWEVSLQWPLENKNALLAAGPYFRFGRHCWTAMLTGLLQPWSKEGCSGLKTLGFAFPEGVNKNAALYVEFTRTDFDDLRSSSVQLGAKLAF